jgi:hypothetical protein
MGCPACRPAGAREPMRVLHEGVTARSQFASPELIASIVYGDREPGDDPRWAESGAPSQAEYGFWSGRWCGLACLLMILEHRGDAVPPLYDALAGCLRAGAYLPQEGGTVQGLIYEPFAQYAATAHGLRAEVCGRLPLADLRARLAAGHLIIASVHREIRRPDQPAPGQGGHLVLVTGYDGDQLHFRNPSGHTSATRTAVLPQETFAAFYAGRGISVAPTKTAR